MLAQSSVDNNVKGQNQIVKSASLPMPSTDNHSMELSESEYRGTSMMRSCALTTTTDSPYTGHDGVYLNISSEETFDPAPYVSWHGKDLGVATVSKRSEDADELKLSGGTGLSAGEWADSLTNISVGDLLSRVSQEDNCIDHPIAENCHGLQQMPFSCDSFDAAIAAHISRHQDKTRQTSLASHMSSIWDAEETCDGFFFKNDPIHHENGPCLSPVAPLESEKVPVRNSDCTENLVQLTPEKERLLDDFAQKDPVDSCESDADIQDHSAKDFGGLADMYWPDSLGPLDLDIPSAKYHSEDLILSDSLSSLNRLIASSLDAFQNCSFFGFDKKEVPSTVETQETAAFSDFKIGSGV